MKIAFYSGWEGSDWQPWPVGVESYVPADADLLARKESSTVYKKVVIHGILLHAFKTNLGAVWDYVNGWRT